MKLRTVVSPRIRRAEGLRIMPPVYEQMRLTVPVREALEGAGNVAAPTHTPDGPIWTVTLQGTVPRGLAIVRIGRGATQQLGLRLAIEPEYPGEWPEGAAIAWYERGAWCRCPAPRCGRALVWYEAGYVPGYRVCTRGHHVQLSNDGRSGRVVREG
jgi:hypothetical protein